MPQTSFKDVLLLISNWTFKLGSDVEELWSSAATLRLYCKIFSNDQHSTRKEVKNACFYKVNHKMDDKFFNSGTKPHLRHIRRCNCLLWICQNTKFILWKHGLYSRVRKKLDVKYGNVKQKEIMGNLWKMFSMQILQDCDLNFDTKSRNCQNFKHQCCLKCVDEYMLIRFFFKRYYRTKLYLLASGQAR